MAVNQNLKPGQKAPADGIYTCIYCGPNGQAVKFLRLAAKSAGIPFSLPPHLRKAPPRQQFSEGDLFPSCPNCQADPSGRNPTGWSFVSGPAARDEATARLAAPPKPDRPPRHESVPQRYVFDLQKERHEALRGILAASLLTLIGALFGGLLGLLPGLFFSRFTESMSATVLFWSGLCAWLGTLLGIAVGVSAIRRLIPFAALDNALVGAVSSALPLGSLLCIRWMSSQWDKNDGIVFATVVGLGMVLVALLGLIEQRYRLTKKNEGSNAWLIGGLLGLVLYGSVFMTVLQPKYGPLVIAIGALVGILGIFACRQANPNVDPVNENKHPAGDWLKIPEMIRSEFASAKNKDTDRGSPRENVTLSTAEILENARSSVARPKSSQASSPLKTETATESHQGTSQDLEIELLRNGATLIIGPQAEAMGRDYVAAMADKNIKGLVIYRTRLGDLQFPDIAVTDFILNFSHYIPSRLGMRKTEQHVRDWAQRLLQSSAYSAGEYGNPNLEWVAGTDDAYVLLAVKWESGQAWKCLQLARALEKAFDRLSGHAPATTLSTGEILARVRAAAPQASPSELVVCDKCGATNRSTGAPQEKFIPFSLFRCADCHRSFCAREDCLGDGGMGANVPCPHCGAVSPFLAEDHDYV